MLKIFDMFYRLPGKIVGSGIGLHIVKETVEKLRGSLYIKSGEGKGTSFVISLKNLMNTPAYKNSWRGITGNATFKNYQSHCIIK